MTISIITYLKDAEFEDKVIEALISKGISEARLEYRAISEQSLLSYLEILAVSDLRRILILDQEIKTDALLKVLRKHKNLVICDFNSDTSIAREEIEAIVNRSIRESDNEVPLRQTFKAQKNLFVVTGTTGAPGVTTLTINLGFEISRMKRVEMLDAHPYRRDLAFLLGAKRNSEQVRFTDQLFITNQFKEDKNSIQLVDAGPIPDLAKAFSDRRESIRSYVNILESAERIFFLMTPDNNHMFELENILASLDAGRLRAQATFLLNQMGSSSRERSIKKRFEARVGNYSSFFLPFDRDSLDRAKARYGPLSDVAPRSRLRRSICEVANAVVE